MLLFLQLLKNERSETQNMIVYRFNIHAYSAIMSVKMKIQLILKARFTWIQHTLQDLKNKHLNWYQCYVLKSTILSSYKRCCVYFKIYFLPVSFFLVKYSMHLYIWFSKKEDKNLAYIRGGWFCFLPLQRENSLIAKLFCFEVDKRGHSCISHIIVHTVLSAVEGLTNNPYCILKNTL